MMKKIEVMQIINLIILMFLTSIFYGQNNKDIMVKEGVFILENCQSDYVSPCGNGFRESKTPQLLSFHKGRVVYDSIYQYPLFKKIEKLDTLSSILFFDSFKKPTDTLKFELNKKQKRIIKKTLKKIRSKRKFSGQFEYLIYKIRFRYIYNGLIKNFIPNINQCGKNVYIETESHSFDVLEILSLEHINSE